MFFNDWSDFFLINFRLTKQDFRWWPTNAPTTLSAWVKGLRGCQFITLVLAISVRYIEFPSSAEKIVVLKFSRNRTSRYCYWWASFRDENIWLYENGEINEIIDTYVKETSAPRTQRQPQRTDGRTEPACRYIERYDTWVRGKKICTIPECKREIYV